MHRQPAQPVVTLITDFGTRDHYVASMKAVLVRAVPDVCLIDVTHQIPPRDILAASIMLERAIASFDAGCIHLAVVDPGVGSDRRIIISQLRGQLIVCPDNGLITWTIRRHGPAITSCLIWHPPNASSTFHGRDIMAPVAGMLAAGTPIDSIAERLENPVLLDVDFARADEHRAVIIHIDHFGNATTNLSELTLRQMGRPEFEVKGQNIGPCRKTYGDVRVQEPIALMGSSGLLEIAVREGSAASRLDLKVGDQVQWD